MLVEVAQSEQLQQRWISRGSSHYLGSPEGEKGMRKPRVEWTVEWSEFFFTPSETEGCWTFFPSEKGGGGKLDATHQLRN